MSRIVKLLGELMFPPKCLGCRERMRPSMTQKPTPRLCVDCEAAWEHSRFAQCPECFAAYCDCTCAPHVLKRAGCAALIKAVPYGEEAELCVVRRILLDAKRRPDVRATAFLAENVRDLLEKTLAELEQKTPISHTVMAHLPRTRHNLRQYGFDQAAELAKALARLTALPYARVLRRTHDGREQKKLTLRARHNNVKGAFALRRDVAGKRVILVDDIVTTGASMAEAVRTLKKAGAAQIVCVCVAATRKQE